MRALHSLSMVTLFLFVAHADAQKCPPGGCPLPATPKYSWTIVESNPKQAALYNAGVHVGNWDSTSQHFVPFANGVWLEPVLVAPFPPPADMLAKADVAVKPVVSFDQLNGVDASKLSRHERHTINGMEVNKARALHELGGDVAGNGLVDDSQRYWLIVSGKSKEERKAVAKAIMESPEFRDIRDQVNVWAGDGASPTHWLSLDRETKKGLYLEGAPRVVLEKNNGEVLCSMSAFDAKNAPGVLRKCVPGYDPSKDPDGNVLKPEPKKADKAEVSQGQAFGMAAIVAMAVAFFAFIKGGVS